MKIYLNILGIKNFEDSDLETIKTELEKMNVPYGSILEEPFRELKRKVFIEQNKRQRSKYVWVEFVSYWSGYTSNQRRIVGKHYRKVERGLANKLPSFFQHNFSDNTTNDWNVKVVSVRGKDEGSYSQQIDEFLQKYKI